MTNKKKTKIETLNWNHISAFGSFGDVVRRFADRNGYVCWDAHIHKEAKLLSQEDLEFEYEAWTREMEEGEWGEIGPGCTDEDDPENYPDWRYARNAAAAYAIEKAVRGIEKWRRSND